MRDDGMLECRDEIGGRQNISLRIECAVADVLLKRARKEQAVASNRAARLVTGLVFLVFKTSIAVQVIGEIGRIERVVFEIPVGVDVEGHCFPRA